MRTTFSAAGAVRDIVKESDPTILTDELRETYKKKYSKSVADIPNNELPAVSFVARNLKDKDKTNFDVLFSEAKGLLILPRRTIHRFNGV